ncbi:hypothetical protein [Thiobacillus sp.]|nr:hypothetical protein [Thiobacillus sp.]
MKPPLKRRVPSRATRLLRWPLPARPANMKTARAKRQAEKRALKKRLDEQ